MAASDVPPRFVIPFDLKCAVCDSLLINAFLNTLCYHRYCGECFNSLIPRNTTCPVDRCPFVVNQQTVIADIEIRRQAAQFKNSVSTRDDQPHRDQYNEDSIFRQVLRSKTRTLYILYSSPQADNDNGARCTVVGCEMKRCEDLNDARGKSQHFVVLKERRSSGWVYMFMDPYPKVFHFRVVHCGNEIRYTSITESETEDYYFLSLRFSWAAVEYIHKALDDILVVNPAESDEHAEFPYGCVVKLRCQPKRCYVNISHAESVVYLLLVELLSTGQFQFPFIQVRKVDVDKLMQRINGRDEPLIIDYKRKLDLFSEVRRMYLDPTDPVQLDFESLTQADVFIRHLEEEDTST